MKPEFLIRASAFAGLALTAAVANAQYSQAFETLTASPGGTVITGQAGFYVPVAGSVDGKVYTYAGNTVGVPANPLGGSQFAATLSGVNCARAQNNSAWGTGTWTMTYDVCPGWDDDNGNTLPTANNLGSVSLTTWPTTGGTFIQLYTWTNADPLTGDVTDVTKFGFSMVAYDILGTAQITSIPISPTLNNLDANKWYRVTWTINFAANRVEKIEVQPLSDCTVGKRSHTFATADSSYLAPGAGPPAGFRIFSGGGVCDGTRAGNLLAVDNVRYGPASSPCCVDFNGDTEVDFSDIEGFIAALAQQICGNCAPGADFNDDTEFDFSDIETFIAQYNAAGGVCP